jgi:hypothetical protein
MQLNDADKQRRHKIGHQTAQYNHQHRVQGEFFADKLEANSGGYGIQYIQDNTKRNLNAQVTLENFLNQQGQTGKATGDKSSGLNKSIDIKGHKRRAQNN